MLNSLAEALGVSVTELVNGEETDQEKIAEQTDNAVLEALSYSKRMSRMAFGVIFVLLGVFGVLAPHITVGMNKFPYRILGLGALGTGVFLLWGKQWKNIFKERVLDGVFLLLTAVAVFVETSPVAIAMKFAVGPGETRLKYVSYFDLLLCGYGVVTPLLTALMSCVLLVLGGLALFLPRKKKIGNACFVCGVIAVFLSLVQFLFAIEFTVLSCAVTALLAAGVITRAFAGGRQKSA